MKAKITKSKTHTIKQWNNKQGLFLYSVPKKKTHKSRRMLILKNGKLVASLSARQLNTIKRLLKAA